MSPVKPAETTPVPMDDISATVRRYLVTAAHNDRQHRVRAQRLQRTHLLVGVPGVAAGVVLVTLVLAAMLEPVGDRLRLVTGLAAVTVTTLVTLQTFLNLGGVAARHLAAASAYSRFHRDLQQFTLRLVTAKRRDAALTELSALAKRLNEIEDAGPLITKREPKKPPKDTDTTDDTTDSGTADSLDPTATPTGASPTGATSDTATSGTTPAETTAAGTTGTTTEPAKPGTSTGRSASGRTVGRRALGRTSVERPKPGDPPGPDA